MRKNGSVKYEIKEHIGVLSTSQSNWTKELNKISWNDGAAKFDIRDWDSEHEHMSKGITLHQDEMEELYKLLKSHFE